MKESVRRGRYLSINAYLHMYDTEVILKETTSAGNLAQ